METKHTSLEELLNASMAPIKTKLSLAEVLLTTAEHLDQVCRANEEALAGCPFFNIKTFTLEVPLLKEYMMKKYSFRDDEIYAECLIPGEDYKVFKMYGKVKFFCHTNKQGLEDFGYIEEYDESHILYQ